MYETLTAYYFDADDENPSCGNCDNCNSDDEVCEECGPEHFWARYYRKELKDEWLNQEE